MALTEYMNISLKHNSKPLKIHKKSWLLTQFNCEANVQ